MGIGIGAAVLGAGAAGAAGNIFSSIFAQKQQAKAIQYSADKAAETALALDAKARADVAPFREVGLGAAKSLWDILNRPRTPILRRC